MIETNFSKIKHGLGLITVASKYSITQHLENKLGNVMIKLGEINVGWAMFFLQIKLRKIEIAISPFVNPTVNLQIEQLCK